MATSQAMGALASARARLPAVGRGAKMLLDGIAEAEGTSEALAAAHGFASGYDVPFGYRQPAGAGRLSELSLDAVDRLQGEMGAHTPVGRYQITRPTLRGLRRSFGLSGEAVFGGELQDALGRQLMAWSGYDDPALDADEIQTRFARTWASIALPAGGSVDPAQTTRMSGVRFQALLAMARKLDAAR
jgi:hypothetical protein